MFIIISSILSPNLPIGYHALEVDLPTADYLHDIGVSTSHTLAALCVIVMGMFIVDRILWVKDQYDLAQYRKRPRGIIV